MKLIVRFLAAGLLLGGLRVESTASSIRSEQEKVDLCEVAKSPATFSGRRISVDGYVSGREPEHLLLFSQSCGRFIPLTFEEKVKEHPEIVNLFWAVRRGDRGAYDRGISGHFIGYVVDNSDKSEFELNVEKIEGLTFPHTSE